MQNFRQFRCQPLTALLPQFLRHAVECLGDAAGDGGEGVAVAAEGYRYAQRSKSQLSKNAVIACGTVS